jgi:thiamine-phosphate pyrophosphorylase
MLTLPSLYVICDAEVCGRAGWTLVDFAAACIDGGATFLQVRAKGVSSAWLFDATTAIVRRAQASGALVVVNDRADLALLAGAGGVHVGQTDLAPAAVRVVVGPEMLVGRSTHTPEQYGAALHEPVDYVAIGPVFATATKATGCDAVGLEGVRGAAARTVARGLPLVAIGGITLDRARSVREGGAQSVAVISDLLATGDPTGRVREFLRVLEP